MFEEIFRIGWLNGEGGDRLVFKVDNGVLGRLEDEKGFRLRGLGGVVVSLIWVLLYVLFMYVI